MTSALDRCIWLFSLVASIFFVILKFIASQPNSTQFCPRRDKLRASDEWLRLLLGCLLGQPLDLVVGIDVAVLTHTFGIVSAVCVHAVGRVSASAEPVITVVAHTLCKVLEVLVRAVRNRSRLAA